ncbi:hypothetical protein NSX58_26155, partial [Salmonella enterica]|nr:hypothetical protein [Salmonella enterica]
FYAALLHGLSVQARDGVSKARLQALVGPALAPLAVSLFVPPVILLAAVLALMGLVLGMRSPRLKRARHKQGVRGVV